METKEEGYNFYRLDTGKEQTRSVFKSYETYPEDVLIKLHGKYISEMKTAVKLKRSKKKYFTAFRVDKCLEFF